MNSGKVQFIPQTLLGVNLTLLEEKLWKESKDSEKKGVPKAGEHKHPQSVLFYMAMIKQLT